MTDIIIERELWDADIEGVITAWLYDIGDLVAKGDVLAEVMVEKVQYEIISPVGGRLDVAVAAELPVKPGDIVGAVN